MNKIQKIRKLELYFVLFKQSKIAILLLGIILSSCIKDDFELKKMAKPEYNPNLAAPLINCELTFRDLLNETNNTTLIHEDALGLVELTYTSDVLSKKAEDLFTIPVQNFNFAKSFNSPTLSGPWNTIPAGTALPPVDMSQSYKFTTNNGGKYDSIIVKTGNFNINMMTDLNQNADILITIPELTLNEDTFKTTIHYVYNAANNPQTVIRSFNITNYKIALTNDSLHFKIRATLYKTGNNPLFPTFVCVFNQTFSNLKYKKIVGYLGQQTIDINKDTIDLGVFSNTTNGSFSFANPKIKLYLHNSFGIPINITFDTLRAVSVAKNQFTDVKDLSGMPISHDMLYPGINEIGKIKEDSIVLSKLNSNIPTALSILPNQFIYAITGKMNPNGNQGKNIILDTSTFKVDVAIELPFYGRASGIVFQKSFDFSFSEADQLDWIKFKLNMNNWFPVATNIQLYFQDENGKTLDSLFHNNTEVIGAALPGPAPSFRSTQSTNRTTETTLSNASVARLVNTKKLLIKATINTSNNGTEDVRIYGGDKIAIKLATQVQLKVKL